MGSFMLLQVVNQTLAGDRARDNHRQSDRRGTIYRIYQLSAMIGVSPWYWWAECRWNRTNVWSSGDIFNGPPAVKYRGIFINDEDWGLEPVGVEDI